MRLFTIADASDARVKCELARINKFHLQARSRLAELEGHRTVSAQFEPMAERVKLYCGTGHLRKRQLLTFIVDAEGLLSTLDHLIGGSNCTYVSPGLDSRGTKKARGRLNIPCSDGSAA